MASRLKFLKKIIAEFKIQNVYTNHDYEPSAIERDTEIKNFLQTNNIAFNTYKDQCVFEKSEVTKDDGLPYTVFTPYANKWKKKLNDFYSRSYPTEKYFSNFYPCNPFHIPSLQELGFKETDLVFSPPIINEEIISHYTQQTRFPCHCRYYKT